MKGYGRTLMAWAAVAIALLAIGVGLWLWLRSTQGVAPSVERYETVSYTHLTLPTKLEV